MQAMVTSQSTHVGWSADCSGSLCDVVLTDNLAIVVTFLDTTRSLRVAGVGYPDAGWVYIDDQLVQLPHSELVPIGETRAIRPAYTPGYTFLGVEGVSCREKGWSATCTLAMNADVDASIRVGRFVEWSTLTNTDGGVWRVHDLAGLPDGGVLGLGLIWGTVSLNGQAVSAPTQFRPLFFLAELVGPNQFGHWSAASSPAPQDSIGFLHNTPRGIVASIVSEPLPDESARLSWGLIIDAGVLDLTQFGFNGTEWFVLRLDQQDWHPTAVATLAYQRPPNGLTGYFAPGREGRLEEGRLQLALRFRVSGLGLGLSFADAGILNGSLIAEPDFSTQRVDIASMLRGDLSANGLAANGRLAFVHSLDPLVAGIPLNPGCSSRDSGIVEYTSIGGGSCLRFLPVDDVWTQQFSADEKFAWLNYAQGTASAHQFGLRKFDVHSLAAIWEAQFAWPERYNDSQSRETRFPHVFEWGQDVLVVWLDYWLGARLPVRTPDGAVVECPPAGGPGVHGSDYYLAVLDGLTGHVKWADCLPGRPPGSSISAFGFELPIQRFRDGLLIHSNAPGGPGMGGNLVVGSESYDTTTLAVPASLLLYVTPPR